ncbi:hypothetical protein BH11PLA2_BH11PLA2_04100 [soil metagenome]
MAKKPAKPEAKPRPKFQPLLMAAGTLAVLVFGYFLLAWLGQQAGEAVAQHDVYMVRFDDIEVAVPPGMDRDRFLTEVKYLASPPRTFSNADTKAKQTVAEAFAKHPWVQAATPSKEGKSPVTLVFRKPVLAVAVGDGPERLVDANGILLPVVNWSEPLPKLKTPQPGPLTPPGEQWLNPRLPRALEFVKDYDAWELWVSDTAWNFKLKNGKPYTLPLK